MSGSNDPWAAPGAVPGPRSVGDRVLVRVRADRANPPVVREVAAAVSARLGADPDDAADLTEPDTTSFGWRVLAALVDSVDCGVGSGPDGRANVHISVVRAESAGAG
ncbi:hypothetical protein [Actinokineospora cianjurensis]|uniref:Uncharacterized protein n=1 Tax=Actinokineospora cianjurensis TaxID=585224 RepID=A0A421BDB2_9PSEU|nr:hypothetical protein [Actinokineospora cianjurensis]RLK62323.1 hypothetical protein CLV68_2880 [Actinokineospora cianjurensis]